MLRIALSVLALIAACEAVQPTPMWGATGHETTATIAAALIDSHVASVAKDCLDGDSLPSVSTWADSVKHEKKWEWSAPLHFINTPSWACDFEYGSDCPDDVCVYGAIVNYTNRLVNASDNYNRFFPLKFLVHFVGDIHQPLHVAFGADLGGNKIEGHFLGSSTNMHSVWDEGIIDERLKDFGGSKDKFASYLVSKAKSSFQPETYTLDTIGQVVSSWATQTAKAACQYAYTDQTGSHIESGFDLGIPYYNFSMPIVEQQLVLGGQRLANLLTSFLSQF